MLIRNLLAQFISPMRFKCVIRSLLYTFDEYAFYSCVLNFVFILCLKYRDQEKGRNSSRYGSSSRRPIISSSTRPSSSGDHTDSRTGRLTSSGNRSSASHRNIQPMYETKQPTYMRSGSTRGNRDDPLRSFELLSIRK